MTTFEAVHYCDSHCHLDFSLFDIDRTRLWRSCFASGIRQLIIPGIKPDQWLHAAHYARELKGVYFTVGIHPWWLAEVLAEAWFDFAICKEQLINAAQLTRCVGIGECGLDASIAAPMEQQLAMARLHCEVAIATGLPIIFHCRQAHNELLQLIDEFKGRQLTGVIHAFSGSPELANAYVRRSFYLGIGGTITYPRAQKTRRAVTAVPLSSLLLETDAPDMPLQGYQGARNNPLHIPQIAQCLALLRGEKLAYLATQTRLNTQRLFFLMNNND